MDPENTKYTTVWADSTKKSIILIRPDGTTVCKISEGDFISFQHREDGVRVEQFNYHVTDPGPRGFKYLPWREKEQRWATPVCDGFGRPSRYVVCYPSGLPTFGEHINWSTVGPLYGGKCPDEI
jgi:hypothetical protein